MRAMKDSGVEWIGKIPEKWGVVRTKCLFSHYKKIVGESSGEYQRLALTLKGVIQRSKDDSVGLQPGEFNNYQVLNAGNLVFKLIDLENVSTSRVGLSPFTGIVSPAYIILTPTADECIKFFYYHFYSMWQCEIFNHMGDDGVRSALNARNLLNIPIPFPPPAEQQRIAAYLDEQCGEIDKVLTKTRESIEEYKKLKQSVITEAVTKGIRPNRPMKPSGIEWIGDIPAEWVAIKLKYLLSIKSGDAIRNDDLKTDGLYPVYGGGELIGYCDIFNVEKKSILIGRVGARCGCITKVSSNSWATDNALVITHTTNWDYIYYILTAADLNKLNTANAQPLITASKINNLAVAYTFSAQEQKEIVAYLDQQCAEIDRLIAKKEQIITELEGYKKSLIYECVTGKREVAG